MWLLHPNMPRDMYISCSAPRGKRWVPKRGGTVRTHSLTSTRTLCLSATQLQRNFSKLRRSSKLSGTENFEEAWGQVPVARATRSFLETSPFECYWFGGAFGCCFRFRNHRDKQNSRGFSVGLFWRISTLPLRPTPAWGIQSGMLDHFRWRLFADTWRTHQVFRALRFSIRCVEKMSS